jgi:hypothetical protein
MLDADNLVDFSITSDGRYRIRKLLGGGVTDVRSAFSQALEQEENSLNTLKVVRVGEIFYFLINGTQVYATSKLTLPGTLAGFNVTGDQRLAVNSLTVTQAP